MSPIEVLGRAIAEIEGMRQQIGASMRNSSHSAAMYASHATRQEKVIETLRELRDALALAEAPQTQSRRRTAAEEAAEIAAQQRARK